MTKNSISIKDDFTRTPGHRSEADGPHSGEEFLEKILRPKYIFAREHHANLYVDLDGSRLRHQISRSGLRWPCT